MNLRVPTRRISKKCCWIFLGITVGHLSPPLFARTLAIIDEQPRGTWRIGRGEGWGAIQICCQMVSVRLPPFWPKEYNLDPKRFALLVLIISVLFKVMKEPKQVRKHCFWSFSKCPRSSETEIPPVAPNYKQKCQLPSEIWTWGPCPPRYVNSASTLDGPFFATAF